MCLSVWMSYRLIRKYSTMMTSETASVVQCQLCHLFYDRLQKISRQHVFLKAYAAVLKIPLSTSQQKLSRRLWCHFYVAGTVIAHFQNKAVLILWLETGPGSKMSRGSWPKIAKSKWSYTLASRGLFHVILPSAIPVTSPQGSDKHFHSTIPKT